jgi:hypothetical protein
MSKSGSQRLYIRNEWVAACHFHDLTELQVLEEVALRVRTLKLKAQAEAREKQAHPLVLLDLDSTLYEVAPRSLQIIREWLESKASSGHPHVQRALKALREDQVGYSLGDTFTSVGLNVLAPEAEQALKVLKEFWYERFFSSRYLPYDRPYAGAPEFAQKLYDAGAEIVYLTGRDAPRMGEGTVSNLIRDRFPWDQKRTHLLLKAEAEIPDLEHKTSAATYVREHGSLVASFENEPPNLIALSEIFPDAMHVFLDTVCSDHPARAGTHLYRIRGFTHR